MKSIISLVLGVTLGATAAAETVTVSLSSKQDLAGELYVALFDSSHSFPDGEPLIGVQRQRANSGMKITFDDIEAGEYALAAYVDQDGNQSLSKNFLGIPTEPFGFSGEAVFGKPTFEEASFRKDSANRSIDIVLDD